MDIFASVFLSSASPYWWLWSMAAYGLVELIFAVLVYQYWLPNLNKPKAPPIIRNFEEHSLRHKLFERMLKRQEELCLITGVDMKAYFTQFIRNWFFVESDDSVDDGIEEPLTCIKETGLPCKEDIDKLISWGYFNVDAKDMKEEWQQRELAKMYALIKDKHGMDPGPKSKQKLRPVQMTLEPLDIKYRPLAIYIVFFIFRCVFAAVLYCYGFSHHVSSTGLPYWYRPSKQQRNQATSSPTLPLLVFHGIAPAGATFYVPMIIWGLATDDNATIDRPIFLFENPAVAFALTDHAPTEQETTEGVWEAIDKHCGPSTEVSTMGHSFGTCLQTYILHSSQGHRVRQMVLLDPVSILLSDPDVITNFVYGRSHHRGSKLHDSVPPGAAGWVMNELFIEHFIRRQFAWYNGELFLEDIPDHCKVLVCLSDGDEILNAQKVKAHIDIFNGTIPTLPRCMKHMKESSGSPPSAGTVRSNLSIAKGGGGSSVLSTSSASLESAGRRKMDVIYWQGDGVGHGSCLFNPSAWQQVRRMMRMQEQQILKEKDL